MSQFSKCMMASAVGRGAWGGLFPMAVYPKCLMASAVGYRESASKGRVSQVSDGQWVMGAGGVGV